jgi:hypothetical protein
MACAAGESATQKEKTTTKAPSSQEEERLGKLHRPIAPGLSFSSWLLRAFVVEPSALAGIAI